MAKAIREADGKALLAKHLQVLASENGAGEGLVLPFKSATVQPKTDFEALVKNNPWLENEVREGGREVVCVCVCVFLSDKWVELHVHVNKLLLPHPSP